MIIHTVQLSRCFERSSICALHVVARRGLSLLESDSRVTRKNHSQTSRNHVRSSRKRAKPFVKHARRESDCETTREMCGLYNLRSIYKFVYLFTSMYIFFSGLETLFTLLMLDSYPKLLIRYCPVARFTKLS